MFIHEVKSGETLWQISSYYDIPIAKIIDINGLEFPNQLVIGQSLLIPTEGVFHTVKSGETLWRIAGEYGVTIQAIVNANSITNPDNIYPGLVLYIPAHQHRVQSGETLWQIAREYGISLENLLKANNIQDPNLIYPGTELIIPRENKSNIEVNGYIYVLKENAIPIVKEDGEYLTYLSPFAYLIREDGNLQPIDDIPAIEAAYAENVVPMMSITNFTSTEKGENLAHVILESSEIQERLLSNIINIMIEKKLSRIKY